jgi:polyhydroxyalkanoate synthesis repressor PhaR
MVSLQTEPKLIKKYKNRRLYDLDISQYITFDDLKGYVLEGQPFQVIDSSSGEDITNATLLQMLVETEMSATQFLSSDILRQLIILAHHPMSKSFSSMLEQMMVTMNGQLKTFPNEYQQAQEAWKKQAEQFFNHWQGLFK